MAPVGSAGDVMVAAAAAAVAAVLLGAFGGADPDLPDVLAHGARARETRGHGAYLGDRGGARWFPVSLASIYSALKKRSS